MKNIYYWFLILIIGGLIMFSCVEKGKDENHDKTDQNDAKMASKSHEIVDCNYTFEEAVDVCLDALVRQLSKYKEKQRDH